MTNFPQNIINFLKLSYCVAAKQLRQPEEAAIPSTGAHDLQMDASDLRIFMNGIEEIRALDGSTAAAQVAPPFAPQVAPARPGVEPPMVSSHIGVLETKNF